MGKYLVVELSEEPIKKKDRMTLGWLENNDEFMSATADYVEDIEEPYEDVVQEFLLELGAAAVYNASDNSITFKHKEMFYKNSFDKFQELAKEATLQEFMKSSWAWKIKEAISPTFGTYIYFDYPQNIDTFIRDCANDGNKFYIGGICQYHC